MDYTTLGYDPFLNLPNNQASGNQQTDLEFDQSVDSFTGTKIQENTMPGSAILDESVTNKKIAPSNRVATAIVSQEANADFGDIQKALDFVNSVGGGKILVLPGTYNIVTPLIIYSDTILEGISTSDCILDFGNSTNNLSTAIGSHNIQISYLTFKNCWNITNGTIFLNVTTNSELSYLNFLNNRNGSNLGFDIYNFVGQSLKIFFCTSTTPAVFYFANNNGKRGELSNCVVSGARSYCLWGGSGSGGNMTFNNNLFADGTGTAIFGKFQNSTFSNNDINMDGNSSFTGNLIDLTSNSNIVWNGNIIKANKGIAFSLNDIDSCKFIGNHINSNKDNSPVIALTNGANDNTFTGNYIAAGSGGTSQDGIKLTDSIGNVITGNWIRSSTTAGTAYAVNISNGGCDHNVVVGNKLQGQTASTNDAGSADVIASNT